MDNTQEEYYGTYLKLKQFATTNATALAVNPNIAAEKVKLDTLLNAIELQDTIANSDDTGFTTMKQNAAAALRANLKEVSRGLTSYFEGKGHAGNLEKVKMTVTEIEYRDDAKLNLKANQVYLVGNVPAVKTDPDLAQSQLLPADIDDLETSRIAFMNLVSLPDEKRGDRVAANKEKAALFETGNKKILPRLDNLMLPFASSNAVLYSKYETARAIDNLPSNSGTDGYNITNFTVPAGGSVLVPIFSGSGSIPADLQLYLRAINGTAIICTTSVPASPCTSGYELLQGVTFKGPISELGLDLNLTTIQLTNPGTEDVIVRAGTKAEE